MCKPRRDLLRIEAEQVAPFHIRDSPFGDEPSDVSDAHTEVPGDVMDVDQLR